MHGLILTVTFPLVFVLAARLFMTFVLQSNTRNADYLLKGVLEGVIVYHTTISANPTVAFALVLGLSGRLAGDFVMQRDRWKLASTLLGIAFGVLMADILSHLTEDQDWTAVDIWDIWDDYGDKKHRRRHSRRRMSEPRRIEELPTVYEELSSIESRSRIEELSGTEVEREVARLRVLALDAAGQRRRFREERKWAWSQGNFARALQLRWQVKKYEALAESFTKEADQKLIEADRAKRQVPPSSPPHEPHLDRESPFVQVVVEGGMQNKENASAFPAKQNLSGADHKVRIKKALRVTKRITRLKPGMQVPSSSTGINIHSGTSNVAVPVESGSEDRWSRKLD